MYISTLYAWRVESSPQEVFVNPHTHDLLTTCVKGSFFD